MIRSGLAVVSPEEDIHWMRRALALADNAACIGEVPVGAVIVRGGEVLGEGFNCPISRHDPSAHAEIVALRAAAGAAGNYRLPGATLYVTVEPCAMCAGALVHARVERLVFAAREPKAGAVASNLHLLGQSFLNHRVRWEEGPLAEEASARMQAFFKGRREGGSGA